jgi:hypothetical protein
MIDAGAKRAIGGPAGSSDLNLSAGHLLGELFDTGGELSTMRNDK